MTLRSRFLDAIIDGQLGNGIIVTRKEFMDFFAQDNATTTGCFLSNSEIETGTHSPSYNHFTMRVSEGTYRVHPLSLQIRMEQRGFLPAVN
jgi:hypothetical protein